MRGRFLFVKKAKRKRIDRKEDIMSENKYKLQGIEIRDREGGFDCDVNTLSVKATYHVDDVIFEPRAKALLMDLDGTSVKSEEFWIWLIEKTVKEISKNDKFELSEADIPFVSGYTSIQHLEYCIKKYGINADVFEADKVYHKLAAFELNEIMEGRGNTSAFKPREHLKEFLTEVKNAGVKIGLVTSGLEYKAIPEVVSTFREIGLGDPLEFYDAIITGGKRKTGNYGTMGELCAKPHPWIYAEIGTALAGNENNKIIAMEDSSSGVVSARTAGYNVIGLNDGNLIKSGTDKLCIKCVDNFDEALKIIL